MGAFSRCACAVERRALSIWLERPNALLLQLHALSPMCAYASHRHPTKEDIHGRMESVRVRTRAEGTKPVEGAPWVVRAL